MNAKQQKFVKALAKFLVSDEGSKSLALYLGKPCEKAWMELRNATPLCGYYEGEEGLLDAEEELSIFLFPQDFRDRLAPRKLSATR